MKTVSYHLMLIAFFLLGAIAYTWPGPLAIWEARSDIFMSDGTDPTTNPFQFDTIHREYIKNPKLFFYGAFPDFKLNAPEGHVVWYSTNEKIAGALFPFFVPIEQTGVLFGIVLLAVNGLIFYALGRSLSWSKLLSFGLAIAWAFSVYTRTRVQVHVSLGGVYIVPLAFLALSTLMKNPNRKGVLLASICFFGCATSAHYYLIFMTVFSPFLLLFFLSNSEVRSTWKVSLGRLVLAVLPATIFLALSFLNPVPSEFKKNIVNVFPNTGQSENWPHPFLKIYSANLEDYFTGDIAIGKLDINPAREVFTEFVRDNIKVGNYHEHAHGIRWTIWIAFMVAIIFVIRNRTNFSLKTFEGAGLLSLLLFGVFAFLCSIDPDWGFMWGPAAWIHWLVEQIRVPNRAGIFTHFCILVFIGIVFQKWSNRDSRSKGLKRIFLAIFALLIVLDFPPFINSMPMAQTVPSRAAQLSVGNKECGMGLHFPYASVNFETLRYFYLLQSLRGTECSVLNSFSSSTRDYQMSSLLGYQNQDFLNKITQNDKSVRERLLEFSQCSRLKWVVFDNRVPPNFIQNYCKEWGGKLVGVDFCIKENVGTPTPGLPDECISKFQQSQSQ